MTGRGRLSYALGWEATDGFVTEVSAQSWAAQPEAHGPARALGDCLPQAQRAPLNPGGRGSRVPGSACALPGLWSVSPQTTHWKLSPSLDW